jgi:hypothetical protein
LPGVPSRGDADVLPLAPVLPDGVFCAKPLVDAMTSVAPSVMAAAVSTFIKNVPLAAFCGQQPHTWQRAP